MSFECCYVPHAGYKFWQITISNVFLVIPHHTIVAGYFGGYHNRNTQCEHPERKSLRGSGNTIPQESGCLLHSGDQIPWWQLPHKGKDTRYKLYWSGNDKGTAGVGVFVAEEWIEKVF